MTRRSPWQRLPDVRGRAEIGQMWWVHDSSAERWEMRRRCYSIYRCLIWADRKMKDVETNRNFRTQTGGDLFDARRARQSRQDTRMGFYPPVQHYQGVFLLTQMRSDGTTDETLWSLWPCSFSQASLRERDRKRGMNGWKHQLKKTKNPRSILHVIILPTFYLIPVAKCHRGHKWNRIYGSWKNKQWKY